MKYQPKVKEIQKYSDSQGTHIVCKGKLVLINTHKYPKEGDLCKGMNKDEILNNIHLYTSSTDLYVEKIQPIIISETEDIEVGDWQINHLTNKISMRSNSPLEVSKEHCSKILALPEHFSNKHLQAIVDGKMKDDDEVLVKCTRTIQTAKDGLLSIHLDQQNHITLFPVEPDYNCKDGEIVINLLNGKEYPFKKGKHADELHFPKRLWYNGVSDKQSLEEAAKDFANDFCSNDAELIDKYWDIVHDVYIEGAQWAAKNNYKG